KARVCAALSGVRGFRRARRIWPQYLHVNAVYRRCHARVRAMNRFLRFGLAGAALVVLLAGIAAAPFLISVEGFQRQIEAPALRATGRELHINGGLHFTLLPQPSFAAKDVTLANMAGGRAAQMVRVGAMRLDVKMIPLFEGRVEVTDIVLDKPEIV